VWSAERDTPVRYTLDIKFALGQVDWQFAPRSPWSAGVRFVHADVEPGCARARRSPASKTASASRSPGRAWC